MNFSGSDIVRIKDVTVATFDVDELAELAELALRYLEITFDDAIDPGKYKKRALDFVLYTKRRNITCDFVRAAFAERLKVPEWQELSKICNAGPTIAAQQAGAPNPDAAAAAPMAARRRRPDNAPLITAIRQFSPAALQDEPPAGAAVEAVLGALAQIRARLADPQVASAVMDSVSAVQPRNDGRR